MKFKSYLLRLLMNSICKSEWFEPAPDSWSIKRMKNIMTPKEGRTSDGNEELLSVTIQNGVVKRSQYLDDDEGGSRADSLVGYKIVHRDDLVNNIMKMSFRCLGVSPHDGIVSPAYSVFKINREKVDPKYINYQLRTDRYVYEYRKLSKGIQESRMRLYDDYFLSMKVIVPSIDEQKLISRYLDKKTSQVDSLVEKVQKKIHLLKEQRTSLINHYVTKGLDPNVEMRESEIDCVGRIPTDWKCLPLKFISEINTGTTPKTSNTDFYNGGQHLWIKPGNLNEFCEILDTEQKLTPLGLEESRLLDKNSVLICGIGTIGKFGFSSQMVTTNQQIHGVCFDSTRLNPRYGLYLCSIMTEEFIKNSEKVVISILNKGNLERLKIPVPPLSEQNQIVNFLETKVSSTTRRIELETQKADLLDEYLQSLISSVVTGKIRVTEDMI